MPLMIGGIEKIQQKDDLVMLDVNCFGSVQGEHTAGQFRVVFLEFTRILNSLKDNEDFKLCLMINKKDLNKVMEELK